MTSFIARASRKPLQKDQIPAFVEADYQRWTGEVQSRCRKIVPAYMVPDLIIPITFLPLSPTSAKPDSKQLKSLFSAISPSTLLHGIAEHASESAQISNRKMTKTEERIRDIIISVIPVELRRIEHTTNVFELGLDSLSAIGLAIRLKNIGYDCTVASVLANPVIEQLASLPLKEDSLDDQADGLARARQKLFDIESTFRASYSNDLDDASIVAVRPCLPLQDSLVALSLSDKTGGLYVNHVTLKLSPIVDPGRLRSAWMGLAKDADILRTCFCQMDDNIFQVVLSNESSILLAWEDIIINNPVSAIENFRSRQIKIASDITTNIHCKPPLRLSLVRSASPGKDSFLFISVHHSLYDRECLSMILDEVYLRYQFLQPPTRTHVKTLLEYLASQAQERSKLFWRKYLDGCKGSRIAASSNPEDGQTTQTATTIERTLKSKLSDLEQCSSRLKATLPSVIQAVFGIVLAATVGEKDVVFGYILSGRTLPIDRPETILSPCITTIPQRINLQRAVSTVMDVIEAAQENAAGSLEYQHTALRHIHRWIGADRPLFDCVFSYIRSEEVPKYAHLWSELESSMPPDFPFAIEFEANSSADTLIARSVFTTAFGPSERAEGIMEKVDILLQTLSQGENTTLETLGITELSAAASVMEIADWDERDWLPEELKMREIVARLCGIGCEDVSKRASFFQLGIDSVIAIQFARLLRQSGLNVSSSDVMRYQCIGALYGHIKHISSGAQGAGASAPGTSAASTFDEAGELKGHLKEICPLGPDDAISTVYACTPLQAAMLTQTLASNGTLYVHHHAVHLRSGIDLALLKSSWERTVERNEILRTSFHFVPEADHPWLAAVHRKRFSKWTELEVSSSISDAVAEIARRFTFVDASQFQEPPVEVAVIKSSSDLALVISMHHSLYDGESIRLVIKDLAATYEKQDLPERPPFSKAAKLILQRQTEATEFWLRRLSIPASYKSIAVPPMLSKRSAKNKNDKAVAVAESILGVSTSDLLRGCKALGKMGTTLQTVALLAFGKILACVLERRDVVFGQVVAGRSLPMEGLEGSGAEAEHVIGPLFNTVPFRLLLDKPFATNEGAAAEIQQFTAEAQDYQHASSAQIQKRWRQNNDGNSDVHIPLFHALFVFQKTDKESLSSTANHLWQPLELDTSVDLAVGTGHPLNFEVEQAEKSVTLRMSSDPEHLSREDLSTFLEDFEQAMRDILAHPSRSVIAYPSILQSLPVVASLSDTDRNNTSSYETLALEPGSDLDTIRLALSEAARVPLESIPLHTSIYTLGLDSIAAIQVAAACRKRGLKMGVADILQGGSLGGICRHLRSSTNSMPDNLNANQQFSLVGRGARSKALATLGVSEEDVEDVLPCLGGQMYHLISWLKSGRTFFESTWTYKCQQKLDLGRLQVAWQRLRERHTILRTTFVATSPREALQIVFKASVTPHELPFHSINTTQNLQQTVLDRVRLEARRPSDLFTPPARLCLISTKKEHDALLLTLHHAAYDAWTIPILISDLDALYRDKDLTAVVPQFGAFVQHTMQSLHALEPQDYWARALHESQPTLLRRQEHKGKPNVPTAPSTRQNTYVGVAGAVKGVAALEASCQKSAVALHTIVLLALARVLARETCTTNPTFGLYHAGRSASFEAIETVSGPCLNVTPVVVPGALSHSPLGSALRMQTHLGERVPYEQSNLRDVLGWAGLGGKVHFNTFVNLLWHERKKEMPGSSSPGGGGGCLFEPLPIGVPTDFTSEVAFPGKTAVDELDGDFLSDHNVFVDVARNLDTDALDCNIRCDRVLMEEKALRCFMEKVAEEIRGLVQSL